MKDWHGYQVTGALPTGLHDKPDALDRATPHCKHPDMQKHSSLA
jgi:hypothetical protein